jgi:putative heme-binding domain-containing protein
MLKRSLCLFVLGLLVLLNSCRSNSSSKQPHPTTRAAMAMEGAAGVPDPSAAPAPQWIWGPAEAKDGEDRVFRVSFDPELPHTLKMSALYSAKIWAACDDDMTVHLNGKQVAHQSGHLEAVAADVRRELIAGENILAIKCHNNTGPAAIALKLEIHRPDGSTFTLVTDDEWTTASKGPKGWMTAKSDDKPTKPTTKPADEAFAKVRIVGPYGMEPWGKVALAPPTQSTPVENLTLPPGFKAELIYSVPKTSQGSWVSMAHDPKGRLYVSDQAGPLYRVTPAHGDQPTKVEQVNLDIGSAQGLLWAFDSLYVVVNAMKTTHESGLYRLRDTDGDDKLDQITTLKLFSNRTKDGPGWGEHGPHAVVLGPDNKLYVVAGNFTNLPDPIEPTSPAAHWAEDLLLERMPDGKGHDPTIYAPGSCVSRTDENGTTWEAFATGMRNAYDMAFDPKGELFTFDSDMEWDMGAPWYRPTRICHVVSGAEFGWRNGSGKWPTYYADSVPPVVNVGPGSPTGVTFGYGAKFPAKYQRTFFANDWAYGNIFAVHLKPDGAGYTADFEPFIVGKPFDVTDIVINTDGAMYITIGGRGTQSGLYRITYTGDESTAPVEPLDDPKSAEARAIRHKLESYHGHQNKSAVATAWPYLNSDDRYLRYAARVAIEAQPPAEWAEKALAETNPTAQANALIALSRVGDKSLQPRILESLGRVNVDDLTDAQQLETLRALEVCCIRMGKPEAHASEIVERLAPLYPHKNADVTHELCQLLVLFKSPQVIAPSIALLEKAQTQEEQLFYVFTLRNLTTGWTEPQRVAMFNWLNRAQQNYTGGASYKLFLKNVREDVIKTLSEPEKEALGTLTKTPIELSSADDVKDAKPHKFVKNYEMEDLLPKLDRTKSGRSYASGRAAFAAVSCSKCHRFNGSGGSTGPDITGAGNRFQPADLLEAIILPSKIISDQYQATEIITKKKLVVVGTIQSEDDKQVVVRSSPLAPDTETVAKDQIAVRRPSKISPMPQNLLDVLTEDEVLDLIAYVRSGGNAKDPAFKKDKDAKPANVAKAPPATRASAR